jgi:hypothetical protein
VKLNQLFVESSNKVLDSFKPKRHLNDALWETDKKLKPIVRKKLLEIADEFYKSLNLPKDVKIHDIVLTGSNANFNWSENTKFSDIDLHLKINYEDIDENHDLVLEFMFDKKALWGKAHNITIYGFPVELFAQDTEQKTPFDAGVYSLTKNEWEQEPKPGMFKLKSKEVLDKAKQYEVEAERLLKAKDVSKTDDIADLIDRIGKLRRDNLNKGGEFDPSNLAFKYLRRKGIIDDLKARKVEIMDKEFTVK